MRRGATFPWIRWNPHSLVSEYGSPGENNGTMDSLLFCWIAGWMALTANPLTHRFRYEPGADTTEPIQSAPDTLIRTPVRTPGLTQHAGPLDWTIEADQKLMNPSATSRHFLRVSISAPSISRMVRPPLNLVVLLDTSGSMSTNNKLNRHKMPYPTCGQF